MLNLSPRAADEVLTWEDGSRRTLAIHHALTQRQDEIWADHRTHPTSVMLLRPGVRGWEVFGTGEPRPALESLAGHPGEFALMAPMSWEAFALRHPGLIREYDRVNLEVRHLPEDRGEAVRAEHVGPPIEVRRLTLADAPALAAALPPEALRSWASPKEALGRGAAFGVPRGARFLAVAWIVEQDRYHDAVGVHTEARYRRLGLGRAAARGLIDHILDRRRKLPLWAALPDNEASLALARSLGLTVERRESILRFGARS
jgi:RimJ/RimL family protein N-acetyltransferase